jgi:hypothetical protein
MKRTKTGQDFFILFPVFGGEMATAKIQLVNGSRVEIFSRTLRKNTTRPLTSWIGGTDKKRTALWQSLFHICYSLVSIAGH